MERVILRGARSGVERHAVVMVLFAIGGKKVQTRIEWAKWGEGRGVEDAGGYLHKFHTLYRYNVNNGGSIALRGRGVG